MNEGDISTVFLCNLGQTELARPESYRKPVLKNYFVACYYVCEATRKIRALTVGSPSKGCKELVYVCLMCDCQCSWAG